MPLRSMAWIEISGTSFGRRPEQSLRAETGPKGRHIGWRQDVVMDIDDGSAHVSLSKRRRELALDQGKMIVNEGRDGLPQFPQLSLRDR